MSGEGEVRGNKKRKEPLAVVMDETDSWTDRVCVLVHPLTAAM